MSRLIIIFLLIVVVVIFTMTYILGALRRLFIGNVTQSKTKSKQDKDELLYEKDDVKVFKGNANQQESKNK